MVIALSTLPEDIFLCDFCRWSFSELVLSPAFLPQIGHTFIAGLLCCQSMEALPCNLLSRSSKALPNPSLGWARRWTFLSKVQASNRVRFLKETQESVCVPFTLCFSLQMRCDLISLWKYLYLCHFASDHDFEGLILCLVLFVFPSFVFGYIENIYIWGPIFCLVLSTDPTCITVYTRPKPSWLLFG